MYVMHSSHNMFPLTNAHHSCGSTTEPEWSLRYLQQLPDCRQLYPFLGQSRSQARLNVIASYDQSNELFKVWSTSIEIPSDLLFIKAFLSKEMMCSCALWSEVEGGVPGVLEMGPIQRLLNGAKFNMCLMLRMSNLETEFLGSGLGRVTIEVLIDSIELQHSQA